MTRPTRQAKRQPKPDLSLNYWSVNVTEPKWCLRWNHFLDAIAAAVTVTRSDQFCWHRMILISPFLRENVNLPKKLNKIIFKTSKNTKYRSLKSFVTSNSICKKNWLLRSSGISVRWDGWDQFFADVWRCGVKDIFCHPRVSKADRIWLQRQQHVRSLEIIKLRTPLPYVICCGNSYLQSQSDFKTRFCPFISAQYQKPSHGFIKLMKFLDVWNETVETITLLMSIRIYVFSCILTTMWEHLSENEILAIFSLQIPLLKTTFNF